jgi:hypothetical protein
MDSKVERAYLIALGRPPVAEEKLLAKSFLTSGGSSFADLCLALINLNEFVYID